MRTRHNAYQAQNYQKAIHQTVKIVEFDYSTVIRRFVMAREVVRTLLIALVLDVVVTDISTNSNLCRSLCVCDIWYGLQHASCTGHHLYSIHTGVPSITQALDLSNNSISVLNNYELAVSIRTQRVIKWRRSAYVTWISDLSVPQGYRSFFIPFVCTYI